MISTGAVEIIEITQNPIKVIQILFFYSFLGDFYDFYGPGRNHVARLISVPRGCGETRVQPYARGTHLSLIPTPARPYARGTNLRRAVVGVWVCVWVCGRKTMNRPY